MIIEEQDFRLEQISENSPLWDLELLYIVKPKNGESRKEFKNVAYGVTLEGAMKRIINYRIHIKANSQALQMKDYLKYFRDYTNKLLYIFNIYGKEKEKESTTD